MTLYEIIGMLYRKGNLSVDLKKLQMLLLHDLQQILSLGATKLPAKI